MYPWIVTDRNVSDINIYMFDDCEEGKNKGNKVFFRLSVVRGAKEN